MTGHLHLHPPHVFHHGDVHQDHGSHHGHLAGAAVAVVAAVTIGVGASRVVGDAGDGTGGMPATADVEIVVPDGTTVTSVTLTDADGDVVAAVVPLDGVARFEDLPAGEYRVLHQAETGVDTAANGVEMSAATTVVSRVELTEPGSVVVSLG